MEENHRMKAEALLEQLEQLGQSALLLTANRRLAAALGREYDHHQVRRGNSAWETPAIFAFDDWVAQCWDDTLEGSAESPLPAHGTAAACQTALSRQQALCLWEQVIRQSGEVEKVLNLPGTVRVARQAASLLCQWGLEPPGTEQGGNTPTLEHRLFLKWHAAWREKLRQNGWMDPASLPDRVTEALRQGLLEAPQLVIHSGFDQLTPQQEALLKAFEEKGAQVVEHRTGSQAHPAEHPPHAHRIALPDQQSEIRAAASWCRARLQANPDAPLANTTVAQATVANTTVAIVVPDLEDSRSALQRAFTQALHPLGALSAPNPARLPFNLSLGLPLARYPLVRCALALLGITPRSVPGDALALLLHSPFVGGAEHERTQRAKFDLKLRRWGVGEPSLEALRKMAEGESREPTPAKAGEAAGVPAPNLGKALGQCLIALEAAPANQSPGEWLEAFGASLASLGWPGERPLDSTEHQTRDKWDELLETFAALELVQPRMSREEAVSWLRRLAGETVFQPQGPQARVQILGLLEMGGLHFDHVWIMGMDDETWPPAPRPNPFLPAEWQRRHGLPRASLQRELDIAQRETERLLEAGTEVVVSYPLWRDEQELRCSPLMSGLEMITLESLGLAGTPGMPLLPRVAEWIGAPGAPEAVVQFVDFQAPPIPEAQHVAGGTSLFQDQAACPFRAFASNRLGARPMDAAHKGLDAAERGSLIHRALERAWGRLKDQATLLVMPDEDLRQLLAEETTNTLQTLGGPRSRELGAAFLELEHQRMLGTLLENMDVEKAREEGFTVASRETEYTFTMGGVEITGIMDRVDRLDNGGHVIFDYKTGSGLGVNAWMGERPDEPQLPLYCASAEIPVAGVAFNTIRRGECGYVGIADSPQTLPKGRTPDKLKNPETGQGYQSTAALIDDWREKLEALGEAFRKGNAAVDPKKPAQTCRYCELDTLCRISELRSMEALNPLDEEDEAGGERP